MKIIPIIGLLYLIKIISYHKSKIAISILINGIIFHSYDTKNNTDTLTKILKYYDIICNAFFTIYILYNNHNTFLYAFLGSCNYMLIKYIENDQNYGKYVCSEYIDFLHVLCVQLPLFFGLELAYN
tara:strand:+ start:815 stop:1192 length:378 start_codon:yes stop_codon:yes gene_type:complete